MPHSINTYVNLENSTPRLVDSSNLYFQEGNSDKVYQIRLEETTQPNTNSNLNYIVNFAFGRRNKWLKRDTKTPNPVSRHTAQTIFDQLLKSKLRKGYIER